MEPGKIRIGTIWERTTEVIAGRAAILVAIAALLLFLPNVVQALVAAITVGSGLARPATALIGLAAFGCAFWGTLAITAVASDPAVDRRAALALGGRRLPALIGVAALLAVVAVAATIPGIVLLAWAGFDPERARLGLEQTGAAPGRVLIATLYFLALGIVGLWAVARLVPLVAVIANERLGLRAFARSFALTRGATVRLIGALLLYLIVFVVALFAASAVVGLVFRLALGPEGRAAADLAAGVAGALVASGLGIVQDVFSAQYYVAARDRGGAA